MNLPLWQKSARYIVDAVTSHKLTCVEVVSATVARVKEVNSHLNAIVDDLSDAAILEAERLDIALKKSGPIGPLHGVPITIKENVDQVGCATPNGVTAFKNIVGCDDAPVVRNLRNAGAIIIGRTNTSEFSFRAATDNVLHGRTFNPWNDWATAGGSSGGAGSAVMAGMGALGHGNDIFGSLRYPAASNGASSIKPGLGRVPAWNPSQKMERGLIAQLMSVQGMLGRDVADLRLAMRAMVSFDPHDPWMVPMSFDDPFHEGNSSTSKTVAFTKNTFEFDLDANVDKALNVARDALVDAGYHVVEIDPPFIREIAEEAAKVLFGEIKILLDSDIRKNGSKTINNVFETYYELFHPYDNIELITAMAQRSHFARQWSLFLVDFPLVLTPFMPMPTWNWDRDLQGLDGLRDVLGAGIYGRSINYLGLPAGNVPSYYNNGLPVGVQIVGRRFREDLVLDACEAIEVRVGNMAQRLFQRPLKHSQNN